MIRSSHHADVTDSLTSTQRQIRRVGDTVIAALRFRLDASIQRVWAACINREQLRRWFADANGDMCEGATVTFDAGAPHMVTSRILRCDPFRYLHFTWFYPGKQIDQVEVWLIAANDGVLVELQHRSNDATEWWIGAGSGWEYALIRLDALLKGVEPSTISAEDMDRVLGPLWTAAGRVV